MFFVAIFGGASVLVSVLATLLIRLAMKIAKKRPERFAKKALVAHLFLAPVLFVFGGSAGLGAFGASLVGTRPDERAYAGPRVDADGRWVRQSRESLKAERDGVSNPDPQLLASAARSTVRLRAADGVGLRAFFVPVADGRPRATSILVHGLFRGGLELEAPASMFRDAGCDVLMLEMRNHGGGDRAAATFGSAERLDVEAAINWVREDAARAARPLVLFAVSLGTAAVMAAAPDAPGLAAVMLDAPADAMLPTAHRMLAQEARPPRRGLGLVQPFRSLTIATVELLGGFRFEDIRPLDAIKGLSPDVRVLVVGAEDDSRMPPDVVRRVFDGLPTRADRKTLWIREGSDHGQVWIDDPEGYASRVRTLIDAVAADAAAASGASAPPK